MLAFYILLEMVPPHDPLWPTIMSLVALSFANVLRVEWVH